MCYATLKEMKQFFTLALQLFKEKKKMFVIQYCIIHGAQDCSCYNLNAAVKCGRFQISEIHSSL